MRTFLEHLYRAFLILYPANYRREYGELMMQNFRDMYRDATQQRDVIKFSRFWFAIVADTLVAAFREHRDIRRFPAMTTIHRPYSGIHLVLVFVPIIAIVTYSSLLFDFRDITVIYGLILITGIVAWVFSRLGLIATIPLWNIYVIGIFLGVVSLGILLFGSLPALGTYRLGLPPAVIVIVSTLIYAAGIAITERLSGSIRRSYQTMAVLLALTAIAGFLINSERNAEPFLQFLSLNYSLMQALAALATAAVSIWFIRRVGDLALIALSVALGVQFIWVDPAYFTGEMGQWIDLAVILFPLFLCPLWWLLAQKYHVRMRGTLVLWAILLGIIAFAPGIARALLPFSNGFHESAGAWIYRITSALPYFAAMWLAVRAAKAGDFDIDMPKAPPQIDINIQRIEK